VTLPEESPGTGDEGKVEADKAEAPTQMFHVDELNDETESAVELQADEEPATEPEAAEVEKTPEVNESADDILDRAFGALRDGYGPAAEAEPVAEIPAAEITRVDGERLPPQPSWVPAAAPAQASQQPPWDPAAQAPRPAPRADAGTNGTKAAMTAAWAKIPAQLKDDSGRPRWKIAAAAGTAAVIAIALIIVAVGGSSHSGTSNSASSTANASKTTRAKTAKSKTVPVADFVSISPDNGSTGVNGTSPITVTYSRKLTSSTPLPTLSPSVAGSWQVSGDQAVFTPTVGYPEGTHVTVNIPATSGTTSTTSATTTSFTTGQYSMLRLEQLLAQLGYLPVTWTPSSSSGDISSSDASAQLSAAYNAPSGTFTFDSGYPSALTSQWSVGSDNEIVVGAVRTFEYDQNLTMDGDAGPDVWSHLLTAVAKNETSQHGYTYVYVQQSTGDDEYLDLYHDGKLAITTPANTGIPASSTADGTYPVYLRYTVTQMTGTNPNGTPYDDTVYWVSYFNGGDAVHAYPRASYGFYQSLGCVELPYNGSGPGVAENVWNLITYGTLVTVEGPVA
jgi:hypothetical protein